jgi:hypothetical protein
MQPVAPNDTPVNKALNGVLFINIGNKPVFFFDYK